MAEIDEAAAVKLAGYWSEVNARTSGSEGLKNMARAALAWKARAEAAQTWKHRAEAAEAEVKRMENVIAADYQLRKEKREYRGTYGYMEGRDILTRRS